MFTCELILAFTERYSKRTDPLSCGCPRLTTPCFGNRALLHSSLTESARGWLYERQQNELKWNEINRTHWSKLAAFLATESLSFFLLLLEEKYTERVLFVKRKKVANSSRLLTTTKFFYARVVNWIASSPFLMNLQHITQRHSCTSMARLSLFFF